MGRFKILLGSFLLFYSIRKGLFDQSVVLVPPQGYDHKVHSKTLFYDRMRFYKDGTMFEEHYSLRPLKFVPSKLKNLLD